MDARDRFVALMASPGADVRLDEAALCIAAQARAGLDIESWLVRIDELAAACSDSSFEAVLALLFRDEGFTGDTESYDDPENSFLDSVITRRRGIPITLSILVIEVARRLGIVVLPVGMPGHFLVRAAECADRWCDPFHGGRLLDLEACHELFDSVYHGTRTFDPSELEPTPSRHVIARVLANLEHGELATDPLQLAWMCEAHLAIPGVALAERVQLLRRLARVVDPIRAAAAYDLVAAGVDSDTARRLQADARMLRSRMN